MLPGAQDHFCNTAIPSSATADITQISQKRPLPFLIILNHPNMQDHGGDPIIPFSGALEAKLLDLPEDEREVYCKEVGGWYCGGMG